MYLALKSNKYTHKSYFFFSLIVEVFFISRKFSIHIQFDTIRCCVGVNVRPTQCDAHFFPFNWNVFLSCKLTVLLLFYCWLNIYLVQCIFVSRKFREKADQRSILSIVMQLNRKYNCSATRWGRCNDATMQRHTPRLCFSVDQKGKLCIGIRSLAFWTESICSSVGLSGVCLLTLLLMLTECFIFNSLFCCFCAHEYICIHKRAINSFFIFR